MRETGVDDHGYRHPRWSGFLLFARQHRPAIPSRAGVLSRPSITTCQTAGKFVITSIESSYLYGASILDQSFTLQSVHQVYHMLDGAISVAIDGEVNVVRVGETSFIAAGIKIQIAFLEKYTRFWALASGDWLESPVENAGITV
ncbi:uncharacterized protein BO97DRAFT_419839 [Aspergillus homomorphus CBS 101889]|uniref:Cupin 2 conserved barrel domain-containing protein n=1 Tax=Aspergillus homomorphus (strain CBS 101889) TaxID=1450537 RepID=A0A395IEK1_ASPHC|nr:hypothetical protein BO97DRAFT_419839 [Aspergillus homomorphus CBS 101889]RAL17603.1 hypothetical protein BO97DRAFT_419839 [Aspergillus homomorphus CBS 101889]